MVKLKKNLRFILSWRAIRLGAVVASSFLAPQVYGGVHFTLQTALEDNSLGLQSQNKRSASASVAFDLGTYFRLGVTHRQAMTQIQGYSYDKEADYYNYSKEETLLTANSIDFTIILYYGELFVPYIVLGMVKKNYNVTSAINGELPQHTRMSQSPVPNGGLGLGIRLNKDFSLKLSYSVSPGVRQQRPGLEYESALDSYTSIGVSYDI